jgi:general secretion pathway protein D
MKYIKLLFLTLLLSVTLSAREQINVNFANLQINDFIKLISKITHKNILIANKINGTVNFVSTSPIYKDELLGILVSVLESKGYTIVKKGSILEVVRSSEAAKHNVEVINPNRRINGPLMVTQAIKVHGENVDIVAAKVRYLISKTAKLMTMKDTNTLLITDYPKNIETIKKVIQDIDNSTRNVVKIVPMQNTDAKKMQKKITDITKSIFKSNVASQKVKVIYDENSNGLIIVGSAKNVATVVGLIKKLDVESHAGNKVEIFELKNSDAKAVEKTLSEIVKKQTFSDPSLKPNISMSEEINAIIVIGEPMVLKGVKLIIDELDKEKYQVYVQAKIVEINKNKSSDIGVKYGFAGGDVSASGLYAMSANFGSDELTKLASSQVLDYLGNIGSGVGSAMALGATLDFLQTHGASKSISNPSILCVNNKESSIYVGKTISVSTGTVTSTSGLNGVTSSYKREDVGLTLKIKPRVSSVDKVTLDVEAVLENILDDGSKNATGQPVTSKQEVKTQAILRNGESIIIGGLVKSYERDSKSKVPLLGDIPLLGDYLFSSTSKTNEQDNLVVILTPYVIDKSDELSKLQKELGLLAHIQEEYNKKAFELVEKKKLESKISSKKNQAQNSSIFKAKKSR